MAQGVTGFTWDQCWEEYRRQVFWSLTIFISSSMLVAPTERGDRMFMAMLARACQQALDLGSVDLLPAAAT
jgi:energy-coupling factor transporter transmembrane protein EcfT